MLLSAGLISVTGDWILLTGLANQVYRLTGSTVASGLAVLTGSLPQLPLGTRRTERAVPVTVAT